ncbi:hypothetical protein, partial [Klebsiella pneumoniae]|uniref:hypothetical protein n=1 Tax=Klebsiella pneumoniae TaxID=573 RepID=UPI00272FBB80
EGTPNRISLFINAQVEALRSEVQLQHRLKLLSTAHRDLMIEVIEQTYASKRPDSQTQVLSIMIGTGPANPADACRCTCRIARWLSAGSR